MSSSARSPWRYVQWGLAVVIGLLAFYNLGQYPLTWFDEGVHLHVPETLVRYGEYADRSSDGFRYFGPTIGVGPTVLLPIAGVFKLAGAGLLQGRLVIALYSLLALYLFYRLAGRFDTAAFAVLSTAFVISSPAVDWIVTGRQVLGEVPGLFFLLAGFLLWFSAWEEATWWRLTVVGLCFGLAAVTKYQNLVVLAPTLLLAAATNLLYYRTAPMRVVVWPGIVVIAVFGLWQAMLVLYLGPQTAAENFAALRAATAGAAAVFSPSAMQRAIRQLLSFNTFGSSVFLVMAYGVFCSVARTRTAQQWGILLSFIAVNLAWYVVASVGWPRYAFAGLALMSLFVSRFVVDGVRWLGEAAAARPADALRIRGMQAALAVWTFAVIIPPLAAIALPIAAPPLNTPAAMSAFLEREVPTGEIIETWEPELGALTGHNFHYPPARLLNIAVRHIWLGGPAPRLEYHPLEDDKPPFVVVGSFARWVDVYPPNELEKSYSIVKQIGGYALYRRNAERVAASNETVSFAR
jgi:4-amino-4-deoxy-L-arabinose transferase-like glycosyltransferase